MTPVPLLKARKNPSRQIDREAVKKDLEEREYADVRHALRHYWDGDAPTYDDWPEHGAWTPGERAAWARTLTRSIDTPAARVLDVGAGTGFLSLAAARLGCQVTALDISSAMLERLRESAARENLEIETICAAADEPPLGPFDVVMERLLLWTVPDPGPALAAWREVAPHGQLLAFESHTPGDYLEGLRRRARRRLARLRRLPHEHHGPYPPGVRAILPIRREVWPSGLIQRIEGAGWHSPQLTRLRDVAWARELALPPLDRLLGVTPEYLVSARSQVPAKSSRPAPE
jgi:SAM-dependent methyltransferase